MLFTNDNYLNSMKETAQKAPQEETQQKAFKKEAGVAVLPRRRRIPGFGIVYMVASGTDYSPHMRYAAKAGALGVRRSRAV